MFTLTRFNILLIQLHNQKCQKNTFFPTLTAGLLQGEESNEPTKHKIEQIKKRVEEVKQQNMEQLSQK